MEHLIVIDRQTGLIEPSTLLLDAALVHVTDGAATYRHVRILMHHLGVPDDACMVAGLWPSWDQRGFDVFALPAGYQHRLGSLEAQAEAVCAAARPVVAVSW